MLQQSVSTNDVEAFEGYPVFSKSSTLCNRLCFTCGTLQKQHNVCVCVRYLFLQNSAHLFLFLFWNIDHYKQLANS